MIYFLSRKIPNVDPESPTFQRWSALQQQLMAESRNSKADPGMLPYYFIILNVCYRPTIKTVQLNARFLPSGQSIFIVNLKQI